jgi:PPK2 family polyphosphate:nucleotide phosphotransferase
MPKPNGFAKAFAVEPGKSAGLTKRDPRDPPNTLSVENQEQGEARQRANIARIAKVLDVLWADSKRGVLIVLQGMDTSGKDGTVRNLMTGLNPMCCHVRSFGVPTKEELDHDFLWRVHHAVPPLGSLGVFNRSHYEDVLVVRVHELVPKDVIKNRYDQINRFEQHLVENNYSVLKFMLHISKDEQAERLRERLADPKKNWKMNLADLKERERWDDYVKAYEDALTNCSTKHAPWYVIPSDRKWFRNLAISEIVADTLETLDLSYPRVSFDPKSVKIV